MSKIVRSHRIDAASPTPGQPRSPVNGLAWGFELPVANQTLASAATRASQNSTWLSCPNGQPNPVFVYSVANGLCSSMVASARASQNLTGYSPETILRRTPLRLPLSTLPSTIWCARGLHVHLRLNPITGALLKKRCRLRKGLPLPGSSCPQAQLSNPKTLLPAASSRSVNC